MWRGTRVLFLAVRLPSKDGYHLTSKDHDSANYGYEGVMICAPTHPSQSGKEDYSGQRHAEDLYPLISPR